MSLSELLTGGPKRPVPPPATWGISIWWPKQTVLVKILDLICGPTGGIRGSMTVKLRRGTAVQAVGAQLSERGRVDSRWKAIVDAGFPRLTTQNSRSGW